MQRPDVPAPLPPPAARLAGVASSPVRDLLALTRRPDVISFAGGIPSPQTFDVPGLRHAFTAVLDGDGARQALQYATTEGDPDLRALLAARLEARGVASDADDILVTAGSQQALTLLGAVLLEPGDAVLVESPAYLAALQSFALAGANLVSIPCDDAGPDPEAVLAAARRTHAKALYLVPNFQNPTGLTIPLARRQDLLAAAEAAGLWIIEDDPYGELRFAGAPIPPLASLPGAAERTVLLSSLSKTLAPGLRVGWMRTPGALRPGLVVAKQAADLQTATITQAAAARWLAHADMERHLDAIREAYRVRRDAMVAGLHDVLPPGSSWTEPEGGMFCWARLPAGSDTEALLPRALDAGVAYVPGAPFYAGEPDRATLRLSYSEPSVDGIAEGLRRLGGVLRASVA